MLRPGRFIGDERALLNAAKVLWGDLAAKNVRRIIDSRGELGQIESRRLITFLDTARKHVYRSGYILRERWDLKSSEREVTLKFRHPDRYVSANRNVDSPHHTNAKIKFEEDLKVPFASFYSLSNSVLMGGQTVLSQLADLGRMFPDLRRRLGRSRKRLSVSVGRRFTAREIVVSGASFQIGRTPKVHAKCALIVWYDHERRRDTPVAVEFSYRYKNKAEDYGGAPALRAHQLFRVLQTVLDKWIDRKARTKTELVYGSVRPEPQP